MKNDMTTSWSQSERFDFIADIVHDIYHFWSNLDWLRKYMGSVGEPDLTQEHQLCRELIEGLGKFLDKNESLTDEDKTYFRARNEEMIQAWNKYQEELAELG